MFKIIRNSLLQLLLTICYLHFVNPVNVPDSSNILIRTEDDRAFNITVNNCLQRNTFNEGRIVITYTKIKKCVKDTSNLEFHFSNNCTIKNIPTLMRNTHSMRVIISNSFSFHIFLDGIRENLLVNDCLQLNMYKDKTIVLYQLENHKIKKIRKNYVTNLFNLEVLELKNCDIKSISRRAFMNLTSLRTISITNNPKLRTITQGIFDFLKNIHTLNLNNNNIRTIDSDGLSRRTLEKLEEVNFSFNQFTEFYPTWFTNTPYIKHLYFQNNYIKKLPRRAFDTLNELQIINFSHNKIDIIESGAFRKLKKLESLKLKHNLLSTISADIFPNQIEINYLDLTLNYLYDIPIALLKKINLKEISIDYNPFLCSCYKDLIMYFLRHNITAVKSDNCTKDYLPVCFSSKPVCENPKNTEDWLNFFKLFFSYFEAYKKLDDNFKNCVKSSLLN